LHTTSRTFYQRWTDGYKYIPFGAKELLEELPKGKQIADPAYKTGDGEVMNPEKNPRPAAKAFAVMALQ
jgi:hypothetical protein